MTRQTTRLALSVVVAVMAWLLPGCASRPSWASEVREITARTFHVQRVIDGDTFTVLYDGELTSVRIVGINAPELREANGAAARDALARLIEGRTVRLEFPGPRKRDHFGRLLAQVYNGEMDIGAEMLKTELAVPFRH